MKCMQMLCFSTVHFFSGNVTTFSSPTTIESTIESTIEATSEATASGTEPQLSDNILPTVVGVVVAVIVVMVLIIVSVILVVMCIRKRNSEWDLQHQAGTDKQTTVTVEDGREGFSNAVYSSKYCNNIVETYCYTLK